MKTHSTNYYNTLVEIAEDCPVQIGTIPPSTEKKSVAALQYELLLAHPYEYSSDELLFRVFATRKALLEETLQAEQAEFFSKGQPCFRASPLTKSYGWGVHSNAEGKIALYGAETAAYRELQLDDRVKKVKAMRSKKA